MESASEGTEIDNSSCEDKPSSTPRDFCCWLLSVIAGEVLRGTSEASSLRHMLALRPVTDLTKPQPWPDEPDCVETNRATDNIPSTKASRTGWGAFISLHIGATRRSDESAAWICRQAGAERAKMREAADQIKFAALRWKQESCSARVSLPAWGRRAIFMAAESSHPEKFGRRPLTTG